MTMLEVLVVIAIAAGLVAGGIFTLTLLTHTELRSEARQFASYAQYTQEVAGLNNRQYKLLIDLDANTYEVRATEAEVIQESTEVDDDGYAIDDGLIPEELRNGNQSRDDDDMVREEGHDRFGISQREGTSSVADRLLNEVEELPSSIEFEQVLVEHRNRPVTRGQVTIHFFPNGMQQQAYVVFRDASDTKYTVITEPLTGRVHLHSGEEKVPDDFGEREVDDGL